MNKPTGSRTETASICRIIDTNANRAGEGLRVVEDYLRFHCQNAFLCNTCKQIRHDLSETLLLLEVGGKLLTCRSTQPDAGTSFQTEAEYVRQPLVDIANANMSRVAEALRTLEENSKIVSAACAKEFASLRYRVYSLGKAIGHHERGNRIFSGRQLYALVDLKYGVDDAFVGRVTSLMDGGVDVVQLRDKQCSDREIITAARLLKRLTSEAEVLFIVNDRPDIAKVVHADGVHVGQEEMSVVDARSIVGPKMLVGVSTHNLQQARQAVLDGADYIGIGPVFPSQTKDFQELINLDLVEEIIGEIGIPTFAIGGMNLDRTDDVIRRGAARIAVSHALWHAEDLRDVARQFRAKLASQRVATP